MVIKEADKVFITLADNSTNTLSDASSYSLTIDDSTVVSAIFSKPDLAIYGSGSLTVNGNHKHGIVSKDDLIITGGTINVSSKSSGIDGNLQALMSIQVPIQSVQLILPKPIQGDLFI